MDLVIIDSHVLLWVAGSPKLLSARVEKLLRDPDCTVLVSSATAWELAIKYHAKKLPSARKIVENFYEILATLKFQALDISPVHALHAAALEQAHRDPFDRMLVAQSMVEKIPLVSADKTLQSFPQLEYIW